MEDVKGKSFVKGRMKRYFRYYVVGYLFFLLVLSGVLVLNNHITFLEATLDRLLAKKTTIIRLRDTIRYVKGTLSEAGTLIPADQSNELTAKYLYTGLDKLKGYIGKGQLVISNPDDKGNEITMPITITGNVGDYAGFVAIVGNLQTMRFPFVTLSSITIAETVESDGNGGITYEITGALAMPKFSTSDEQGAGAGAKAGAGA